MSTKLSTFKTSFAHKKLKTNAECLSSFRVQRNVKNLKSKVFKITVGYSPVVYKYPKYIDITVLVYNIKIQWPEIYLK